MTCDQELELAFNVEVAQSWIRNFPGIKPYEGPFAHLDLEQPWFCPRCVNLKKPLLLNPSKTLLYCSEHTEVCDYEYANFEERKKSNTFLTEGYHLPLSLKDTQTLRLKFLERRLEGITERRQLLDEEQAQIESDIIQLKQTMK